jgi:hypothetical protein
MALEAEKSKIKASADPVFGGALLPCIFTYADQREGAALFPLMRIPNPSWGLYFLAPSC